MTKGVNVFEGLKLGAYGNQFIDGVSTDKAVLTLTAPDAHADSILVLSATNLVTTAGKNVCAIDVIDNGSISSGYVQGFYVNLTISGTAITGGNATQYHAFAADITLDSVSFAGYAGGGYIYIAKSASFSGTGGAVYGLCLDIQEVGQVDLLANLWLQNSSTNASSSYNAYIMFSNQGASGGKNTTMFQVQGQQLPAYFLKAASATANGFISGRTMDAASSGNSLTVYLGSTTYYIPLYSAT